MKKNNSAKKKVQQKLIWATTQLYCEKKKYIGLQPWVCITRGRLAAGERVTIQKLYCDKEQQVG